MFDLFLVVRDSDGNADSPGPATHNPVLAGAADCPRHVLVETWQEWSGFKKTQDFPGKHVIFDPRRRLYGLMRPSPKPKAMAD